MQKCSNPGPAKAVVFHFAPASLALLVFTVLAGLARPGFTDPLDNWHKRDSGTEHDLNGVAYANGTFVAVGNQGTVLSSPDGVTWTARFSGTTVDFNGVTYQQGRFFALGAGGVSLTSLDGIDWRASSLTSTFLYDLVYANGTYVLVGLDYVATSSDGDTWALTAEPRPRAYTVAHGNGLFAYGGEAGNVKTSVDGRSWVERLNETCAIEKIIYTRDHFYAVGCPTGYVSPDGINWTTIDGLRDPNRVLTGIADGHGTLVAVGYHRRPLTPQIRVSRDGLTWSVHDPTLKDVGLESVTFGRNSFVAVGEEGTILQSDTIPGSVPPSVVVTTNAASFRTGDRLRLDVTISNPGDSVLVDVYLGAVLPLAASPGLGCAGNDPIAVVTAGFAEIQLACVSAAPQSLPRLLRGVELPAGLPLTPFSEFFKFTWTGSEPPGAYTLFLVLARAEALTDGSIDAGDLLGVGTRTVSFAP